MEIVPVELMGDVPTQTEEKDRARYSHPYSSAQHIYVRRGSLKPSDTDVAKYAAARPVMQTRTNSAPTTDRNKRHDIDSTRDDDDTRNIHANTQRRKRIDQSNQSPGLLTRFDSISTYRSEDRLPEINVAVIGAKGVGKTTFVQRALDLPNAPEIATAEQKISYRSHQYLIRLLEISIDEISVDDDDESIIWPDIIGNRTMPKIDGAMTLYDVRNKSSLNQVPEVLTALSKASVPSILISCKCDVAPFERDLDPVAIEEKAKRSVRNLVTLQTSNATSDNHRRGISMIIRAITSRGDSDGGRRRSASNAHRQLSPRTGYGHARAASEHSSVIKRNRSLARDVSTDRLKSTAEISEDGLQRTFLFEESGTDSSEESSDVQNNVPALPGADNTNVSTDAGASFDELVDKLLAQPMSKADGKFAAIFLALYRKFAAPGRLLEAIVQRIDAIDHVVASELTKATAQLRYLAIIQQWIETYPGDFAFAKTKRRIQTMITKIGPVTVLTAAANEMSKDLAAVKDNDDTNWAYNDRDRQEQDEALQTFVLSPTASTLLDDLDFNLPDGLGGLNMTEEGIASTLIVEDGRRASESSTTSSQIILNPSIAQKEAALLSSQQRTPFTKDHWRVLMEIPDDIVAQELTRMDWILFSSIRPRDLVRHVSLSGADRAPYRNLANVDRMIDHFNHLACWVANFVLLREKPKHRALMLEKFMRIARKLRELNNYNSLGAIIAGVKSSSIHRLAATKELVTPAFGKDWMKLEVLMSPTKSHSAYRLAWENSSSERIPYLPLHRRDLVSAEEGNKTFINDEVGGRINWKKFEIIGETIVSLQRAQSLPYHGLIRWKGGEQVRDLILDLQIVKDEEELYERSTQCEPPAGSGATTSARFREFFKR